jgi:hypothetical protein
MAEHALLCGHWAGTELSHFRRSRIAILGHRQFRLNPHCSSILLEVPHLAKPAMVQEFVEPIRHALRCGLILKSIPSNSGFLSEGARRCATFDALRFLC